jgi:LmbE family N-acetylglucosaminyl deacetylase
MQNTSPTAIERADELATPEQIIERLSRESVVLAIWAHPDDESFLAGGLISAMTDRGARVINVTATSGEHGTPDPEVDPPAILGPRRQRELEAALEVLGVDSQIHLGFGDGACGRVPLRTVAYFLGKIIDRIDPDVVVTFCRVGVTGHPDHRAIGRWVRRAVAQRADRIPLITTAVGAAWPDACVERLHTINVFWPGYPDRTTSDTLDVAVALGDPLVDRKLAALACHGSQMGPVVDALGPTLYRLLASVEAYRPANQTARELFAHRLLSPNGRDLQEADVSHLTLDSLEPAMS